MTDAMPKGFPPQTLAVQRAVCAVSVLSPNNLIPCLDALYHSFWVDGNADIGKPEGFLPVLEKTLGGETAEEVLKAVRLPPCTYIHT